MHQFYEKYKRQDCRNPEGRGLKDSEEETWGLSVEGYTAGFAGGKRRGRVFLEGPACAKEGRQDLHGRKVRSLV